MNDETNKGAERATDATKGPVPAVSTVELDALFDVRARLEQLGLWYDEWKREDELLAQRALALDVNDYMDAQIGVQLSSLRRRLRMKLVAEPIELSSERIEEIGYTALRRHLVGHFTRMTTEERLLWLNNYLFIMTPDLRDLNNKIAQVRAYRALGQQRCFLLGGPSGMGKTTYLDWFTFRLMQSIGPACNRVPVIKIDAPVSNKSPRPLFQRIVLQCGKTYTKSDREEDLLDKIALYFQWCDVELLIIDEVEHIMRPELRRRVLEISNLTRGVPVICASCHPLRWIEGDSEIAGRFNDFFLLEQYTGERLSQLLAFIELLLPFTQPSNLPLTIVPGKGNGQSIGNGAAGLAALIERWTGGILRDIMLLVIEASTRAIRGHSPSLTPELLESTWRSIQTSRLPDLSAGGGKGRNYAA